MLRAERMRFQQVIEPPHSRCSLHHLLASWSPWSGMPRSPRSGGRRSTPTTSVAREGFTDPSSRLGRLQLLPALFSRAAPFPNGFVIFAVDRRRPVRIVFRLAEGRHRGGPFFASASASLPLYDGVMLSIIDIWTSEAAVRVDALRPRSGRDD